MIKERMVLNEIVIGYRNLIEERYQYTSLQQKYDLPKSFTQERVVLFRNYFLAHIYPTVEKRVVLNDAFGRLDHYLKHPEKLLRLLFASKSLLFKYGRSLPKILYAGLKALKSFRIANDFEHRLAKEAVLYQIESPFDKTKIEQLIKGIPRRELEKFISNGESLFEILYDRTLVEQIQKILEHLIANMKNNPAIYSSSEITALKMGLEMIREGHRLFYQLSKLEQKKVMRFIVKIERDSISDIFERA